MPWAASSPAEAMLMPWPRMLGAMMPTITALVRGHHHSLPPATGALLHPLQGQPLTLADITQSRTKNLHIISHHAAPRPPIPWARRTTRKQLRQIWASSSPGREWYITPLTTTRRHSSKDEVPLPRGPFAESNLR